MMNTIVRYSRLTTKQNYNVYSIGNNNHATFIALTGALTQQFAEQFVAAKYNLKVSTLVAYATANTDKQ